MYKVYTFWIIRFGYSYVSDSCIILYQIPVSSYIIFLYRGRSNSCIGDGQKLIFTPAFTRTP